jgi:hypothetical protein
MPDFLQLRLTFLLVFILLEAGLPFAGFAQKKNHPESAYPEALQFIFPKLIPYRQINLWGYADSTGTLKIKPQYSMAKPFEQGLAVVYKNDLANLIDLQGKERFKWEFRTIDVWHNRLVCAETPKRLKGLYTLSGKEILPPIYREVTVLKRNIGAAPNLIVAWTEEMPIASVGGYGSGPIQTFGLFTEAGKPVLPVEYQHINYLGAGIIEASKDGKFYYFNESGKPLPAFQGYRVGTFSHGFATIKRDNKYGFIDSTGTIISQPQYEDTKEFSEGRAAVRSNRLWAFIDEKGNLLTPFKFAEAWFFRSGFAVVKVSQNQYSLLDKQGKEVTEQIYSYIYEDVPGKLYALNNNGMIRYGLVAKDSGKLIVPEGVTEIKRFSEGWAVAVKDGKKGYIDENGNVMIPFDYVEAMGLKDGLMAVHNGKGWGVINKKKEEVIPFLYNGVEIVDPDRFIVWIFNRPAWGLKAMVNAKGEEIIPLKYTFIGQPQLDRIAVMADDKWGVVDMNGRELVKPQALPAGYKEEGGFKSGIKLLVNRQTNKIGYVDWKGRFYFKD